MIRFILQGIFQYFWLVETAEQMRNCDIKRNTLFSDGEKSRKYIAWRKSSYPKSIGIYCDVFVVLG